MERREYNFQLIGDRFSAIVAVCLTGLFTAADLRALLIAAPSKPAWLVPLDGWPLPIWSGVAFNLFFYFGMPWGGFWFVRGTQGKERVVVAGFFLSACLSILNPIEALSFPPAITVLRLLRTTSMAVAFLTALLILQKSPTFDKGDARTALRLLLFVGGLVVFMFVVGAALYFIMP